MQRVLDSADAFPEPFSNKASPEPAGVHVAAHSNGDGSTVVKPTLDEATERAARVFLRRLDTRYPTIDALVFGSRARGTHRPDSDADVAVILRGQRGNRYRVCGEMAKIAFDVMLETGVLVDPMPVWEGELERPGLFSNPALLAQIRRDGLRL